MGDEYLGGQVAHWYGKDETRYQGTVERIQLIAMEHQYERLDIEVTPSSRGGFFSIGINWRMPDYDGDPDRFYRCAWDVFVERCHAIMTQEYGPENRDWYLGLERMV